MPKNSIEQLLAVVRESGLLTWIVFFGVILLGINVTRNRLPDYLARDAARRVQAQRSVNPETALARASQQLDQATKSQSTHMTGPEVAYDANDFRNPFTGPVHRARWIRAAAIAAGELSMTPRMQDVEMPRLKIQGVVWGGPRPTVIINDQTLYAGDEISGVEVVRIEEGHVVLKFQDVEFQHAPTKSELGGSTKSTVSQSHQKTRRRSY